MEQSPDNGFREGYVSNVVGAKKKTKKNNSHGIWSYPSPIYPFALWVHEWRINPPIVRPVRNK